MHRTFRVVETISKWSMRENLNAVLWKSEDRSQVFMVLSPYPAWPAIGIWDLRFFHVLFLVGLQISLDRSACAVQNEHMKTIEKDPQERNSIYQLYVELYEGISRRIYFDWRTDVTWNSHNAHNSQHTRLVSFTDSESGLHFRAVRGGFQAPSPFLEPHELSILPIRTIVGG